MEIGNTMNLNAFFKPITIALVGASNVEGKMGNLFVRHLLEGFPGKIFPIHPNETQVEGMPAFPDIASIPDQIDLVIPLVPSGLLLNIVKGIPGGKAQFLLAIPSGFGEVPDKGEQLERELIALTKERDIRVIGPNSAGMMNCTYGLNASMMPVMPAGDQGLSIITQSGGFGMAVYMYCHNHQMGLSKLCDLGNTADVSVIEMLQYLGEDEDTQLIGLYLESIEDETDFFAQASEIAKKKPVIVTRLGRTAAGGRASLAHIGKISETDRRAGAKEGLRGNRIVQAQTGLELLNIAKGMSWQPLPKGKKVGIITGSGGIGAELTDLCVEHGLEVPEFSPKLQGSLRPYLPPYTSVANPVDLTPLWWQYYQICPPLIRAFQETDEVDILILTVIDIGAIQEKFMYAIAETNSEAKDDDHFFQKPVYIFWGSTRNELQNMRILEDAHIPCYHSTLETVHATSSISKYATQSA